MSIISTSTGQGKISPGIILIMIIFLSILCLSSHALGQTKPMLPPPDFPADRYATGAIIPPEEQQNDRANEVFSQTKPTVPPPDFPPPADKYATGAIIPPEEQQNNKANEVLSQTKPTVPPPDFPPPADKYATGAIIPPEEQQNNKANEVLSQTKPTVPPPDFPPPGERYATGAIIPPEEQQNDRVKEALSQTKPTLPPPNFLAERYATGAIIPPEEQEHDRANEVPGHRWSTGLIINPESVINETYAKGLLMPSSERDMVEDEATKKYFDEFRYSRQEIPGSYSSVQAGYDTAVKNQGQCGSCAAFSTVTVMEICFNKLIGVAGDLSEQQLVDCAYGTPGGFGCNGAYIDTYFNWGSKLSLDPAYETQYPYKDRNTQYQCPSTMPKSQIGALFGKTYSTYQADEELMKRLVYENGAVLSTVTADAAFQSYRSGVFSGCTSKSNQDHAITVVGYGTENGEDYWLVKNSWGAYWGDKGYIKMKRGVHMCGIGKHVAVAKCVKSDGPTQPPPPPTPNCEDLYANCDEHVKYCNEFSSMKTGCKKTCNFCEGATTDPPTTAAPTTSPSSTTETPTAEPGQCEDQFGNCAEFESHCEDWDLMKTGCRQTCSFC